MTGTLCAIRKPIVWHLELIHCASQKDGTDDSRSTQPVVMTPGDSDRN